MSVQLILAVFTLAATLANAWDYGIKRRNIKQSKLLQAFYVIQVLNMLAFIVQAIVLLVQGV